MSVVLIRLTQDVQSGRRGDELYCSEAEAAQFIQSGQAEQVFTAVHEAALSTKSPSSQVSEAARFYGGVDPNTFLAERVARAKIGTAVASAGAEPGEPNGGGKKLTVAWKDLQEIDRFVIFEGSERIYDIYIKGRKIRLEGKEIIDYNVFRLRFFETFGVLLATYKSIGSDWAHLVTHWHQTYGVVEHEKTEVLSDSEEAKEIIIDYINNCSVAEVHVIEEGVVCVRDGTIFVPTQIIKKLLKRQGLVISMRKLAYFLDDYLSSGSIPLKVHNKSERFWKFHQKKFSIDLDRKLEVVEENDG